ncbi:MAG: hypothetical protein RHS_2042 [Robinsoniella sp. RHS]|nr:MAG: hypothetical protein RHS_2042 [Robinsoniella sp. RHS]
MHLILHKYYVFQTVTNDSIYIWRDFINEAPILLKIYLSAFAGIQLKNLI